MLPRKVLTVYVGESNEYLEHRERIVRQRWHYDISDYTKQLMQSTAPPQNGIISNIINRKGYCV